MDASEDSCAVRIPTDRQLLDDAQLIIPLFSWRRITTEEFGAIAVGNIGTNNGFVMLTETEFWLDQKSGPLSGLGEPVLTTDQRQILAAAIKLVHQNRLHSAELVMHELFS